MPVMDNVFIIFFMAFSKYFFRWYNVNTRPKRHDFVPFSNSRGRSVSFFHKGKKYQNTFSQIK